MKSIWPNLLLLAMTLAIAATIGEFALRARVGPPIHWRFPQERYVEDPDLGFAMAPNQDAFTHDERVQTNSLGIRDREFAREPATGVRRVLALGDSQTFGNGLDLAKTWPKQLETQLETQLQTQFQTQFQTKLSAPPNNVRSAIRFDVINAGLAGSNTEQHLRMFERLYPFYQPSVVVLGFYVNDVVGEPIRPSPSADQQTNTARLRTGYWLKRSALFTALWQSRHAIAGIGRSEGPDWETRILLGTRDPEIEAGWSQVERSLREMHRFADAHDVGLIVVVIPRRDQVSGDQQALAYQRHLREITESLGIVTIDPLDSLRAAYAQHGSQLFITWDGHNGAVANRIIAEAAAAEIVDAATVSDL